MKFSVEYTDTSGGEANYSWVRRAEFDAPADARNALLMRRAKALVSLSGARGVTSEYGDMIEFRPHRSNTVMFITAEV